MELHEISTVTGERIKGLREERHMSQKMLAARMYVARTLVSGWENGNSKPNVGQYKRLSQIFDVSVEYLTGMDDERVLYEFCEFEKISERNAEKRSKFEEEHHSCEKSNIDLSKLNKLGKLVILEIYESLLKDKKYRV